jgi:hypothetical protein
VPKVPAKQIKKPTKPATKPVINDPEEDYDLVMRMDRVLNSKNGTNNPKTVVGIKSRLNGDIKTLGPRTVLKSVASISARTKKEDALQVKDVSTTTEPNIKKQLEKNAAYQGVYKGVTGIVKPEYNLLEAFAIYDTEIYVRQAITRRLSLMFRNGWDVVSDVENNQKNVAYIKKRLATLEYVMDTPIQAFFEQILYNLLLTSNCFLYKIRDTKASPGIKNKANRNRIPVAGYAFIPTHQIMPYFEVGQQIFWRRYYETGAPFEDIPIEDIIHLKWDVKTGHWYGTPRLIGVKDDIFALRRLEENIELLFINYLFPLFHVQVGSKEAPCWYGSEGQSEIDLIKAAIENMPKEGIFVTDERVAVKSVGAEGQALDTKELIAHLKQRVLSGLGVSSLDVGETGATRSAADNVSQNLKDQIKSDLTKFCDLMRMHFFKEWFQEANYSLSVQNALQATHIRFKEIDIDNKLKLENHLIQQWLNDSMTLEEYRHAMQRPALTPKDVKTTHSYMANEYAIKLAEAAASAKASAKDPAANTSNNRARPANQHGRNPAATKAKSNSEVFYELLLDELTIAKDLHDLTKDPWHEASSRAVDLAVLKFNNGEITFEDNKTYTNQPRIEDIIDINSFKVAVAVTDDIEILSVVISSKLEKLEELEDINGTTTPNNQYSNEHQEDTAGRSDPEPGTGKDFLFED